MNLYKLFVSSVSNYPNFPALIVKNKSLSYQELNTRTLQVAYYLNQDPNNQIGIFGSKSLSIYLGVLATLAVGKTYVPLNKKYSPDRNLLILQMAKIKTIVADLTALKELSKTPNLPVSLTILCPEITRNNIPAVLLENYRIITKEDFVKELKVLPNIDPDSNAYLLFTSGSTGIPKGVPISHKSALEYVLYLIERYKMTYDDSASQVADLTFDPSVHDMFCTWGAGAALYPVPDDQLFAPANFIKENKLSIWFSVPSIIQFLKRLRLLKEGVFPSLRLSLFSGEALPVSLVRAWQVAAPHSAIENIYGPTETQGVSHYRIPDSEEVLNFNGIASIGTIFPSQDFCLIDEEGKLTNKTGELCIAGSQLSPGYWENESKTNEQFFKFPNSKKRWYKTGDIVENVNGNLLFKGRKDFQIKIRGYRIELEEINHELRKITGNDLACTVAHPVTDGIAESLYSFVDLNTPKTKEAILRDLREKLADYMIPKDLFFVSKLPLNANGKVDQKRIIRDMIENRLIKI